MAMDRRSSSPPAAMLWAFSWRSGCPTSARLAPKVSRLTAGPTVRYQGCNEDPHRSGIRRRFLVTLVPGLTYAPERDAIGVDPKRRGAFIDEALPLLRRLWAGETVSHEGTAGSFRDVKLSPLPVQQPLEVWLGGTAPAALERCGRLSDGWLPSLCTPEEAAAGRVVIEEAAARAGRSISSEHFGVSIGYAGAPIDPATLRMMTARRPRSVELTPVGLPAL